MSNVTMISTFKRAFAVGATVLAMMAGSLPAQAQELDPELLASARQYVDLTDKSGIYEVTIVQTAIRTLQQLLVQNPELSEQLNKSIDTVVASYKDRKSELMDQFARVYALNFTKEELDAIVAFYSSPVGAKLAAANATLNESLQTVMQVFEANLNTEFFAKVRAEMKAAGFDV